MKKLALALTATVIASALPMAAHAAIVTIATSSASGTAKNFLLVNTGNALNRADNATFYTTSTGTATSAGAVLTKFSFLQSPLAAFVTGVDANFSMVGTIAKGSNAILVGNFLLQPGVSGSFSFTSTTVISLTGPNFIPTTYAIGSNLLSATFSNAAIFGSGTSGSLSDSILASGPGSVVFSSDFLDFSNATNEDLSLALTAISPALTKHLGVNGAVDSFRATIGGQYSTDPEALINNLAVVPEPATWAMMIGGFGLIGCSLRARRKATLAFA